MANKISDETIEYVGILAKLELSEEEKLAARSDMERMLDYIDTLNELDTSAEKNRKKNCSIVFLRRSFSTRSIFVSMYEV